IDLTEVREAFLDHAIDVFRGAEVAEYRQNFHAEALALLGNGVELFGALPGDQHQIGTFAREGQSDDFAIVAACTGDQRRLTLESHLEPLDVNGMRAIGALPQAVKRALLFESILETSVDAGNRSRLVAERRKFIPFSADLGQYAAARFVRASRTVGSRAAV